jgi:hypothetical protein
MDGLKRDLSEKLQGLCDRIVTGQLTSFEEYKAACAEISAYRMVLGVYIPDEEKRFAKRQDHETGLTPVSRNV